MTWDEAAALLQPALDNALATHTLEAVKEMIDTGHATLFAGRRSALVATVEEHPSYVALCLWLAGGDLRELVDELKPQAEAWGRSHGCTKSIIYGRRGWTRALPDYRPAATVFAKELR